MRLSSVRTTTVPAKSVDAFSRDLYPRLVGALALDSGDLQLAEEIAQETLFRVYQNWATVSSTRAPDAWTFRVAFNLQASWFRRQRIERRANRRTVPAGSQAHESDPTDVLAVRQAVLNLPRRQRQAIILRHFNDLSISDAARVMSCREGTVKSLTAQAISSLRGQLGLSAEGEDQNE